MVLARHRLVQFGLFFLYALVSYLLLVCAQTIFNHLGGSSPLVKEMEISDSQGNNGIHFSRKLSINNLYGSLKVDENDVKELRTQISSISLSPLFQSLQSFCQSASSLLAPHPSFFKARRSILSHCGLITEEILPELQDLLAKHEFAKFEKLRRSLARSLFYQRHYLRRITNSTIIESEEKLFEDLVHLFRRVQVDLLDANAEVERRRRVRITRVAGEIQRLLRANQLSGSKNCENGERLHCHFIFSGGFAYGVNRLVWCLSAAFILDRRLVHSAKHNLDESLFKSSNLCNDTHSNFVSPALQYNVTAKDVNLMPHPLHELSRFMPGNVPESLVKSIVDDVDDISSWYVGQLTRFLMQPTAELEALLQEHGDSVGINLRGHNPEPIVGIHVRRGDKKRESSPQPVAKYVEVAEEYFLKMEMRLGRDLHRKLFLATDDEFVLNEIRTLAPHYEVHRIVMEGVKYGQRHWYKPTTLKSIVIDMFLLAHSDFFVGTLSSNVGCVVYQMRQAVFADAEALTVSLDSVWWMNPWNNKPVMRARMAHTKDEALEDEHPFDKEDIIMSVTAALKHAMFGLDSPHLEGVQFGAIQKFGNARTGTYPVFKTEFAGQAMLWEEQALKEYLDKGPTNVPKIMNAKYMQR